MAMRCVCVCFQVPSTTPRGDMFFREELVEVADSLFAATTCLNSTVYATGDRTGAREDVYHAA